jgi:Xaa-Pro aminopeptidase
MTIDKIAKEISTNDAYLIKDEADLLYLTNFSSSSANMILTKKKAYYLTNALYYENAKKHISKKITVVNTTNPASEIKKILDDNKIKTLFFDGQKISYLQYKTLKHQLKKYKLQEGINLVQSFREQKDTQEIKSIKKAVHIAEKTLLHVIKNLKQGVSEKEIAWEIEKTGRQFGADDISFTPIVAFERNTCIPHHKCTSKKLKKGMMLLIDMGMKIDNYCSDLTRVYFTKDPSKTEEKIYNTTLAAQKEAIKAVRPGLSCQELDNVARSLIANQNLGENFTHSLGHGIGLEVHESPAVSSKNEQKLKQGTIITIEPGIYLPKKFGVRIEDMVLLTEKGCRTLTSLSKNLKDVLISIK